MTDIIERARAIVAEPDITPSCVEALESYNQADEEGIIVFTSRQAIHETIDAYRSRVDESKDLARALIREREAADRLADAVDKTGRYAGMDLARVDAALTAYRKAQKETDDV